MVPVFSSYFHVSLYFAGCNMDSKMWMEDSKMQHESKDVNGFEDAHGFRLNVYCIKVAR